MHDIELYRQILGISAPWQVVNVDLLIEDLTVNVYLAESPDAQWCCPICGAAATLYDHREERRWRHLDSCQFQTYLVASLPRARPLCHAWRAYGRGSVDPAPLPPHSRFTLLF
jgi:hypothetical protein